MLLMDEPSMGLSPAYVERTFEIIQQLNRSGIGILLVEQNANMALAVADRGYVLQTGRVVLSDRAQNLVDHPMMRKAYLEL
jgi:branched-chain amino acid transport system ATP-binding protein